MKNNIKLIFFGVLFSSSLITTIYTGGAKAIDKTSKTGSINGITMKIQDDSQRYVVGGRSFGRACAIVQGKKNEDPVNGCRDQLGRIRVRQQRSASLNLQGAKAEGKSGLSLTNKRFKLYSVSSDASSPPNSGLTALGEAQFRDPLIISDSLNESFKVDLQRSFLTTPEGNGLFFGGNGSGVFGSYLGEMSTNITDFLFSLEILFSYDSPLIIDLTLSSFVQSLPGWNESTLENILRSLLDADNPDNNFSLNNFDFPDIPIDIPAGESLVIFSSDIVKSGITTPESHSIFTIISTGAFLIVGILFKKPRSIG